MSNRRVQILFRRRVDDREMSLLRKREDDLYQALLVARTEYDADIKGVRAAEDKELSDTYHPFPENGLVSSSQSLSKLVF